MSAINFTCDDQSSSWEKAFKRIRTPLEEFIHDEAAGGLLLMICAALAMLLANSSLSKWYESFLHAKITVEAGPYVLSHTVHHWINDGLMALFFFVVGLEIKREILVGELADIRQAALPIAGAIGGMIAPALIYFMFNPASETSSGWAIPMATDIAFAIGVLVLLGDRVPKALVGFLLALAIVDDLGAVIVIALFYTKTIVWSALFVAGFIFVLLTLCNIVGIRTPLPYLLLGVLLWLAMLKSGIHATLAGVLTALTIPASSKCTAQMFSKFSREMLDRFDKSQKSGESIMENSEQQAVLQGVEDAVHGMEAPLQRLEHGLHHWVSFLIIPVFAFANAGIAIDFSTFGQTFTHPVTLGIVTGLILGKFFGIFGACWLMLKIGNFRLPNGVSLEHLAGVSFLAGIGFTMSIFVGELAFADQQDFLLKAKTGVIAASLIAGCLGAGWLYKVGNRA
jgi:NhaA family Na+:H+ antiporter